MTDVYAILTTAINSDSKTAGVHCKGTLGFSMTCCRVVVYYINISLACLGCFAVITQQTRRSATAKKAPCIRVGVRIRV